MAFTNQVLGVFGGVSIGGKLYTVKERPRFMCPPNWDFVAPLGHVFDYIYAEGLRQPVFEVVLIPRDETGGVFSADWWTMFLDRSPAPQYDAPLLAGAWNGSSTVPSIATAPLLFSNGYNLVAMSGVKADSFSISTRKGEDLTVTCRFVGSGFRQWLGSDSGVGAVIATLRPPSMSTARPLRHDSVSLTGTYADAAFSMSLSYSNNLTANMALNGSPFPTAMQAGKPTGSFSIEVQALDAIPTGEITGSGILISNSSVIASTGGGTARTCAIALPRLRSMDDASFDAPLGKVMRSYQFRLLGSSAGTVADVNGDPIDRLIVPTVTSF